MKSISVQEAGRRGGKMRAKKLSKERLSEIGKKAVQAREEKKKSLSTGGVVLS